MSRVHEEIFHLYTNVVESGIEGEMRCKWECLDLDEWVPITKSRNWVFASPGIVLSSDVRTKLRHYIFSWLWDARKGEKYDSKDGVVIGIPFPLLRGVFASGLADNVPESESKRLFVKGAGTIALSRAINHCNETQ